VSRLSEALEELAHDAPRPVSHPELWGHGRRLRRRDRVVSSALVLVMVLLVGGLATLVVGPPARVAPADEVVPDGAIPSRIEDADMLDLEPADDLAVGRSSLAFVSSEALTVVVSATDGSYHRFEPPDRDGARTMRLSPDGTHLAYVYRVRPQGRTDMLAGVAVVDLESGEVERWAAVNGGGTTVDIGSIGWSPDGRWVAWSGIDVVSWDDRGPVADTTGTMGAIDTEQGLQSTSRATPGPVGVSDDGVVVLVNRRERVTLDATTSERTRTPLGRAGPGSDDVFAGGEVSDRLVTSADGSLTAVGLRLTDRSAPFVARDGEILQRELAPDLYPGGGRVTPLGWAAPSLLMAMVEPVPGSGAYGGNAASLVLMTSPDRPESGWTYRFVVRDLPDLAEVSVAVDLVPDLDGTSSQALTRDFGSQDAGLPDGVRWGGTALFALGVLLAAYTLWRRERRLG
jgi:hypothetical protein